MRRLTTKTLKGAALKMDDTYPTEAAAREDLMRRYRVAIDRLAAYEDTGLTPEEIKDFVQRWEQAVVIAGLCKQAGVDHLQELVKAEKDGRLVVLPAEGGETDAERYGACSREGLETLCRMKDKTIVIFERRYTEARKVIDLIAEKIGIDPIDSGLWLYSLDADGSSAIAVKIDDYLSKSGEKVRLKKRVDELEKENSVLRSLLTK